MDLGTAIGLIFTLLTLLGGVAGTVKAYGMLHQRVKDLADDAADTKRHMEKLEVRLEKAETAAYETSRLASTIERAVEHLGEKFSGEVKRLGDIWELNYRHTNSRLDDIKDQLDRKVGP